MGEARFAFVAETRFGQIQIIVQILQFLAESGDLLALPGNGADHALLGGFGHGHLFGCRIPRQTPGSIVSPSRTKFLRRTPRSSSGRFACEYAAAMALQFIARDWRHIRDLGHGRLEILALAAPRAPLQFPEILEGAREFFELPQGERTDRLTVV